MILVRGLLAPFVAMMLVCVILVYYFASYSRDQVETTLVRIASGHCHLVDRFLDERASDLRFAAASFSIDELSNQADLTALFRNLQAGSEAFFDLGVFDETGNHLEYVGPYDLAGKNYADAEWFKAVREEGLYISDVFLGYRKMPHFIIAVRRDEGERTWYLRATIDTLSFNGLVEGIRVGQTGEAYLVNRKGILQTTRRSGGKLMESDPDFPTYVIDDENVIPFSASGRSKGRYLYATGPLKHVDRYLYATGPLKHVDRYLYATAPLKHVDWVLVVRQEAGDAYGPLTRAVVIAVAVILLGGTVTGFMAYLLASGLANSLALADMEKQHMKTQLVIAGKLAEVGEMSAGLAHEINNPLQVMQSELTMIEDVLGDMEGGEVFADKKKVDLVKDSLDQFHIQIGRCSRITKGLLKFARKTEPCLTSVTMQKFLPEVISMVANRAHLGNVRITQQFADDLPPITTDSNQLQQVFLNLLNNALFALKDRDSAEIRVKAFQEGRSLVVSVEDNGYGIPPDNMEKIFVPFFTTKPPGQGTGLGLSTTYAIVEGLGGDITVTSEPDVETVFTVRLPLESDGAGSTIGEVSQ